MYYIFNLNIEILFCLGKFDISRGPIIGVKKNSTRKHF